MKTKKITLLIFVLFSFSIVYPQLKINDKTSINYMKANLQVIASDEFEGRETGTRGEKLTALFIASEFQKYGLTPIGDEGTYFQKIKLAASSYSLSSKLVLMPNDGGAKQSYAFADDFIKADRNLCDLEFRNLSASIVFAGFGITAPEYKYDDYSNIDVKGKIVLLLPDEPYSEDSAYFLGSKPSPHANSNAKIVNAIKHGAVGVVFTPESWKAKYWSNMAKSAKQVSYSPAKIESNKSKVIPSIILSEQVARKFLENELLTFDYLSAASTEKKELKSFELKKKVQFDLKEDANSNYAVNVVGLIEGTDPKLKNEYVLLTAHLDHVGTRNGIVSNGADDDGSGTVSVMEVARILKENKLNKRSVIALLVTGEEKGLWGSSFAANNSSFIPNTVANINIDMDGRESPDSIHVIGSNKLSTEYYDLIRDVNAKTVKFGLNYKYDDPNDRQRFFYRSDHYNFALKGIPIVFFFDDLKSDYHQPTDDVEKINFDKMLKVVKLSANIAIRVANLNHRLKVDKKLEGAGRNFD